MLASGGIGRAWQLPLFGERFVDPPDDGVHGSGARVGFATEGGFFIQLDLPFPHVRFDPLDDCVALAAILHAELTRMEPGCSYIFSPNGMELEGGNASCHPCTMHDYPTLPASVHPPAPGPFFRKAPARSGCHLRYCRL